MVVCATSSKIMNASINCPALNTPLRSESGNRLRADIVAAAYRAQRFAVHVAPLDCLAPLVDGELGLAPEFDAFCLCVGAAPCRAFLDAAMFQLRGNAKDRKNDLGKIGSGIEERLGQ